LIETVTVCPIGIVNCEPRLLKEVICETFVAVVFEPICPPFKYNPTLAKVPTVPDAGVETVLGGAMVIVVGATEHVQPEAVTPVMAPPATVATAVPVTIQVPPEIVTTGTETYPDPLLIIVMVGEVPAVVAVAVVPAGMVGVK
jgi:hypothetical protein